MAFDQYIVMYQILKLVVFKEERKSMTNEEYKKLSVKEFTQVAERYESDHAGIYEMCKKDYPEILEELD